MAGRPKRRARERAALLWDTPKRREQSLVEALGGCDTRGYDVARHIETDGAPLSELHVRHHQRTLPRFIGSGNDHTTSAGRYEIVTLCKNGRLTTTVWPL